MGSLAPGVLLKLLDAMDGGGRPFGQWRTALLQVTDIVPVGLDDKGLWPTHGFYLKVSDSSHSIYASLPSDQDDLILTNQLKLGQFVQVDRLEPGTPVPVLKGAKPVPGRHPVVGTPEHIAGAVEEAAGAGGSSTSTPGQVRRRGSWGSEQPSPISAFSPKRSTYVPRTTGRGRKPAGESVLSRVMGSISEASPVAKIRSLVSSNLTRTKSLEPTSLAKSAENNPVIAEMDHAPSRVREEQAQKSSPSTKEEDGKSHTKTHYSHGRRRHPPPQRGIASPMKSRSTGNSMPLPRRLELLGKEAMRQRTVAQRAALRALRDASTADNLLRIFKSFSNLSASARSDVPTACFDQFLSFHRELMQAIGNMEATSKGTTKEEEEEEEENDDEEEEEEGEGTTTTTKNERDGSKVDGSRRTLESSVQLARKLRLEAGNWFVEFLEAALKSGGLKQQQQRARRSCSCPQSLLLKVINWLEVEQSNNPNVNLKAKQMIVVLKGRSKSMHESM